MTIKLNRDNPGGAAISGKTISLRDVNTGLAPATGTYTNLSSTTDVTDANGYWEFTMDLGTGPLYVQADLGGGNSRYRHSQEMFIYDSWPISNLSQALRGINDGVIPAGPPGSESLGGVVGIGFGVTSSAVRVLTIEAGHALIRGYLFGWETGTKAITGVANGAAGTTRYDLLVLRQWYNGASKGKQDIVLVQGGSSTRPVVTTTESDLTQFIRGANIWDLPIYEARLAFGSSVYTMVNLRGTWPYPVAGKATYGDMGGQAVVDDLFVTDYFEAQNDAGDSLLVVDNASGVNAVAPLVISSYVKSNATSPSLAVNAVNTTGAGSGANGSIAGTDRQGRVTINPSGTPGAGRWGLITMDTTMPDTNYNVWLRGIEDDSIDDIGHFRALPVSTTTWEIEALDTPSSNQHIWMYQVEAY
jgi:hypothetical protein